MRLHSTCNQETDETNRLSGKRALAATSKTLQISEKSHEPHCKYYDKFFQFSRISCEQQNVAQTHPVSSTRWGSLEHFQPYTPKTPKVHPEKNDIRSHLFIAKSSTFRTSFLWKFFNLSSIYHLSFIPYITPKKRTTNQPLFFLAMQQQRTAGSQRRPSLLFHEVTSGCQVVLMTEILPPNEEFRP